jgi:hypothetical protein
VREKNIFFKSIGIDEIKTYPLEYDAIIISQDKLRVASKQLKEDIIINAEIPFLFIKSEKSYMPFTIDELEYDDVTWSSDYYITFIYYIDGNLNWMNYRLYNDKENTKNIEGVYSRAFELISILDIH